MIKGGTEKCRIMEVTNVRWWASQCPHSAPFQEIEDSKARSERGASHTISHILSLAGSFVARTVYVETRFWLGHHLVWTHRGRIYQWGVVGGRTECGPGKFMGQQGPGTVVRLSSRHVQFIANNCQINHAFLRKLSNFMWQLFDQCPINNRHVELDDCSWFSLGQNYNAKKEYIYDKNKISYLVIANWNKNLLILRKMPCECNNGVS